MKNSNISQWPNFSEEELDKVASILKSGKVNYWTGEEGRLFEKEFAEYIGCGYAVAVSNGSVAIELALKAAKIQNGDEVIVTPRSFMASASSVVSIGATPIFADVDLNSQNITAETIKEQITNKTKAIICVHLAGLPCDMDPIMALAQEHNLVVIEDCAQAHGARYKNRRVGSIGHIGTFSFCQDKIISTAGEGGMLTTNNKEYWLRAWEYKDHGRSWSEVNKVSDQLGFKWLCHSFGTNWRMPEICAAIGRIQVKKLDAWLEIRNTFGKILHDGFAKIDGLRIMHVPSDVYNAYYKYYVFLMPEKLRVNWGYYNIVDEINKNSIFCAQGVCPEIYKEKAFSGIVPSNFSLTNAQLLGECSMMFLVDQTLPEDYLFNTIEVVKNVMQRAIK